MQSPLPFPVQSRLHTTGRSAVPARPLLRLSLSATTWGSAGAAATLLYRVSGLSPIAVSCWRFTLGALLLLAGRAFVAGPRRRAAASAAATSVAGGRRDHPASLVATGVLMALSQTTYLFSVAWSGLAVGTAVTLGAGPLLTSMGARALFGERVGRRSAVTIGLAIAGLLLLAHGSERSSGAPRPLAGFAAALAAAAASAGINLLAQATAQRQARGGHGREAGSDSGSGSLPYDRALAGFAVGAVCLLLAAGPFGTLLPRTAGLGASLALLGYLGAVPTALAYALFFSALVAVRATTVSVVLMLEPVGALLLGTLLLGERLTPAAAVGTAVLLGAVLLLSRSHRSG